MKKKNLLLMILLLTGCSSVKAPLNTTLDIEKSIEVHAYCDCEKYEELWNNNMGTVLCTQWEAECELLDFYDIERD